MPYRVTFTKLALLWNKTRTRPNDFGSKRPCSAVVGSLILLLLAAQFTRTAAAAIQSTQASGTRLDSSTSRNPTYTITDLGRMYPSAINNNGQIVGQSYDLGAPQAAALWENGALRPLQDSTKTWVAGINDRKQSIGTGRFEVDYPDDTHVAQNLAVRWNDRSHEFIGIRPFAPSRSEYGLCINNSGEMVIAVSEDPSYLPYHTYITNGNGVRKVGLNIEAHAMNDSEVIVGLINQEGSNVAFQYRDGELHYLERAEATDRTSNALAISNSNLIVGSSGGKPCLWTNGKPELLWGGTGEANDINDQGWVVGTTFSGGNHATTWVNKEFIYIEELIPPRTGWDLDTAVSINNRGQIVGTGELNGEVHGYLVTPLTPPDDEDGDGLLTKWEEAGGIDVDGDGRISPNTDVVLKDANPRHKDIYVEIDSMKGFAPEPAALKSVEAAFAGAPGIMNPDRKMGITLHLMSSHDSLESEPWQQNEWPQFDYMKANYFGSRKREDDPALWEARSRAYRYCVFASTVAQKSGKPGFLCGRAKTSPGPDFWVALGSTFWQEEMKVQGKERCQAGVFMHELGHCLGLSHGGWKDPTNFKPNYHSVMNYLWMTPARATGGLGGNLLSRSWKLDYSREAFPLAETDDKKKFLDKGALVEQRGIGGHPGHWVLVGPPPAELVPEDGPVDWNRDGDVKDVLSAPIDINWVYPKFLSDPGQILKGQEDWSHVECRIYPPNESITYVGSQESSEVCDYSSDIVEALNQAAREATIKAIDVSSLVKVSPGPFRYVRAHRSYVQTVDLKNMGPHSILGPISLVLDDLSETASISNKSGSTSHLVPLGSPFVNAKLGQKQSLRPKQRTTVVLRLESARSPMPTYRTRVLAGPGRR